jgi:hypothetical protein
MRETEGADGAPTARTLRPGTRLGRPFERGNPGKRRGARDRRTLLGQQAALALESQAWDVVEKLLHSSSWRARHEATKTILSYALGLPRATLELSGGFGDLSKELSLALAEARARRAELDEEGPKTPPICTRSVPALPAQVVAETVTGDDARTEEPLPVGEAPGKVDE